MKKAFVPIISILMIFLVYGCTEKIDIKLDSTYIRLIVDARITTDTTKQTVILTKTASYYDNSAPIPVTGAVITIDDGTNTISFAENPLNPGVYETPNNVYGVVGKIYNLTIKNVDVQNTGIKQVYNATTTIYPPVKLDSVQAVYNIKRDNYRLYTFFKDPPEKNYYVFDVYKNGVLQTDSLNEVRFFNDALINGNYIYGLPIGRFVNPSDSLGDFGKKYSLLTVELRSVSEDYYNFLVGVQAAMAPQIPLFSGPPANVKGNINNGAFGFFLGYSSTRISMYVLRQ